MKVTFEMKLNIVYEINLDTYIITKPSIDDLKVSEAALAESCANDIVHNLGPHCEVISQRSEVVLRKMAGTPVEGQ